MIRIVGLIGVGIMGKSMVRNLMKSSYEVHIYARTKSKVEDVIAEGAIFHDSIRECIECCDAVITIVGYPKDVEEVYFGSEGILENAKPGTYLIDMTTSSPKLAERIFEEAQKRNLHALDAPVTGGDVGAREGTLSVLAGGIKDDFRACLAVLASVGRSLNYEGKAGCGQHAKMANQIMIAGTLSGLCEALNYAKAKGLDLDILLESVSLGAAGSKQMDILAPKILKGDFEPGFFIKHFVKDMNLAAEEAKESGLHLEILEQALDNFRKMEEDGKGDLGTQALIQHYES